MILKLHDSGQAHAQVASGKAEWSDTFKPESDTHCANATIEADFEYQLEIHLAEIFDDFPTVVRVECAATGRVWER